MTDDRKGQVEVADAPNRVKVNAVIAEEVSRLDREALIVQGTVRAMLDAGNRRVSELVQRRDDKLGALRAMSGLPEGANATLERDPVMGWVLREVPADK